MVSKSWLWLYCISRLQKEEFVLLDYELMETLFNVGFVYVVDEKLLVVVEHWRGRWKDKVQGNVVPAFLGPFPVRQAVSPTYPLMWSARALWHCPFIIGVSIWRQYLWDHRRNKFMYFNFHLIQCFVTYMWLSFFFLRCATKKHTLNGLWFGRLTSQIIERNCWKT